MSRRTAVLTLCLSLLLAGAVAAARSASRSKLAVIIAPSESSAEIETWAGDPVRHSVPFHLVHELPRGRTAHVVFLVTGHAPGPDRLGKVDVDISLRRPDGSIASKKSPFARLKGWECLAVGYAMTDPTLELSCEPTDSLGEWHIEAVAHDRISGATATASYPITFVK